MVEDYANYLTLSKLLMQPDTYTCFAQLLHTYYSGSSIFLFHGKHVHSPASLSNLTTELFWSEFFDSQYIN